MMRIFLPAVLAASAALALPGVANAQQGFAVRAVNLRAGPAQGFPLVMHIGMGAPMDVFGCVDGFTWCDVGVPGGRGWVHANFISFPFQAGYVPIYTHGPALGIPLISFNLNTYWGSFYVGRPWFDNRNYWNSWRPPVYRPHPRPPGWQPAPPPSSRPPEFRPPHNARPPGPPSCPDVSGPPPRPQPDFGGQRPGANRPPPQDNRPFGGPPSRPESSGRSPHPQSGPRDQGGRPPQGNRSSGGGGGRSERDAGHRR